MTESDYPTIVESELAAAAGLPTRTEGRVIFDARCVGPKVSGIGRYSYHLLRELLRLDERLEFVVLTHPHRPRLVVSERVECRPWRVDPYSPLTPTVMSKWIDQRGSDLYHSPFNFGPLGMDVPTVLTVHDVMWLRDVDFQADNPIDRYVSAPFLRWATDRSVREADRILTVSNFSRRTIVEEFPGVSDRIDVAYNAVDPFFAPVEPAEGWPLLADYLPPRRRFILAVGVDSPYKNHVGALEGFVEAFGDDPSVSFVLVQRQTGRTTGRIGELLEHPTAGPRIHRLEYVTDEELRALYSLAETFLFPSFHEGFGLPILEAMACGTPVVTSDRGAMAEVSGGAAINVDPADSSAIAEALRLVADDADLRDDLREAGLTRAAEFDWERCGRATLRVYRELIGDRSTTH